MGLFSFNFWQQDKPIQEWARQMAEIEQPAEAIAEAERMLSTQPRANNTAWREPDDATLIERSKTVAAVADWLQIGEDGVFEPWPPGESARRYAARHFAFLRWLVEEYRLSDWSVPS